MGTQLCLIFMLHCYQTSRTGHNSTQTCHNLTQIVSSPGKKSVYSDFLDQGKSLLIYIWNFHVLSNLLLIYICKLHWNINMTSWTKIYPRLCSTMKDMIGPTANPRIVNWENGLNYQMVGLKLLFLENPWYGSSVVSMTQRFEEVNSFWFTYVISMF